MFGCRVIGAASSCTELAAPGALIEVSWSLFDDCSAMNSDACPPAGRVEPGSGPSTNTLSMLMPSTIVLTPKEAGWYSSVGALRPASQPASAGTSMARAPISRRRFQRVTVWPPRLIPSGTERIVAVTPPGLYAG